MCVFFKHHYVCIVTCVRCQASNFVCTFSRTPPPFWGPVSLQKRTLRKQANDNSSPPTSAAPLSAGGARGGISIVAVYGDANSSDSDGDSDGDDSDLEV